MNNYGEYRIVEIFHKAEAEGVYECHFKAIPGGSTVLPEPRAALPASAAQVATVTDNGDPKGMGRVKVQLLWQRYQETTSWIRVLMPDAGQSAHHAQNRGHVFVPKVGDQVMVGFRHDDPQRPYVMGALFNGTNGAGGGTDNTKKSIVTRFGHVIEFNDTDKAESITITDKNKNIIFIDTANSSIHINAPENISISAKNIDISASENLTASAGENMGINAGENITMGAGKDATITASEDMRIMAKNIDEQASERFESLALDMEQSADVIIKNTSKEDIELNSSGNVKSNTADKANLF